MMKAICTTLLIFICLCTPLYAQHSIEVQRAAANSEYWEALRIYEKMPKRSATLDAVIAAGKSAWALSLPERAKIEFDKALLDEQLPFDQRAELLVSRGIIEFQDENYELAILFAEKAVAQFEESHPFRARAWLLWGESLYYQNAFAGAEQMYKNSLNEIDEKAKAEVHFLLARCLLKNGKKDEAKSHFTHVPLNNERAAESLRHLAAIAYEQQDYKEAKVWLEQGREHFASEFLDSWVDYTLGNIALDEQRIPDALAIQAKAHKTFPPSDYWLTLLDAKIEAELWARRNDAGGAGE